MVLKSGREIPDANELTTYGDDGLCYGYDGHVDPPNNPLTSEEKREIADAVIVHWYRWAYGDQNPLAACGRVIEAARRAKLEKAKTREDQMRAQFDRLRRIECMARLRGLLRPDGYPICMDLSACNCSPRCEPR